jgi:hypothetical protein
MEHKLQNIYYNLGQAGAYTGPAKIHQILQERGIKSPGLYIKYENGCRMILRYASLQCGHLRLSP